MEQIEIMPRREGSGQAGTRELLSTASPILAGLSLSPVGKGILAAVATIATAPQDSEAGIFSPFKRMASKGAGLIDEGAAVFPDMTRNVEFNTAGFANYLHSGGDINKVTEMMRLPDLMKLSSDEMDEVFKANDTMKQVFARQSNDITMRVVHRVKDSTNAFFKHPDSNFPQGSVTVRKSLSPYDKAGSVAHEFTHSNDTYNKVLHGIMRADEDVLGYTENLAENRAFLSGYRASFPKELTEPSSPNFIHPMISVAGGKADFIPALDYVNNLRNSYKAMGKEVNEEFLSDYMFKVFKETDRIQKKLDTDEYFAKVVAKATDETSANNAAWTLSREQKKALKEVNEDKARQMALDQLKIYTEPGYSASSNTFKEVTEMGDFDAFYNPTKDFGTYNNVVKDTVKMSPQEYLDRTVKGFESRGYKKEDILGRTEKVKLDKLRKAVEEGATLPSPSLRYAYTKGGEDTFSQEGWHRAILAKEMGIEEIPVSVIYNETKGY